MNYLKAYINYDAISSFENVKGQVEIYEYSEELGDTTGVVEYESYTTEEEMLNRVNHINNNKFTWDTL